MKVEAALPMAGLLVVNATHPLYNKQLVLPAMKAVLKVVKAAMIDIRKHGK